MTDICDVVLAEHEEFCRLFAELDVHREDEGKNLTQLWEPLAQLLDRHAAAEEDVLYPRLLHQGEESVEETVDAIEDHNKIRDAVRDASGCTPGSDKWWSVVRRVREENSDHLGEEERGTLADLRANTELSQREQLAARFLEFNARHTDPDDVDTGDKDPDQYIADHEPQE